MAKIHEEEFNFKPAKNPIDVEDSAKRDGYERKPETNAESMGTTEQSIVNAFKEFLNEEIKRASEYLRKLKKERGILSTDGILEEVYEIPKQTESEMNNELRVAREELLRLNVLEQKEFTARQIFILHNKLMRPAYYPESTVYSVATLLLLIVIESAGNAYFFAKGSELGYFGGIMQAILVSSANVVVIAGISGAFLGRLCHHVNFLYSVIASASLALLVLASVFFNLLVAHYRTALEKWLDIAMVKATELLYTDPFSLDFDSWILFVLGTGASAFSGYKWYSMDDPYPNYGKVDRRYVQAQRNYTKGKEKIQDRITVLFDNAKKKIVECSKRIELVVIQFQTLLSKSKNVIEQYPEYMKLVQNACHKDINLYRDINQMVRAIRAPEYFHDPAINLPEAIEDPFGNLAEDNEQLQLLQLERNLFLESTCKNVNDILRETRKKADITLEEYFSTILEEARERVDLTSLEEAQKLKNNDL